MQTLTIDAIRIRLGQEVKTAIAVEFRSHRTMANPIITIKSNWQPKKQCYKDVSDYAIEKFTCDGEDFENGRGFRLSKMNDSDDTYDAFIGDDHIRQICTCRGFESHGRCKHVSALVKLIDAGTI